MSETVARAIIIAEVAVAFAASGWFVVRYATRSPWWKTSMGRHLMALSATLAGLTGLLTLAWITGPLWRPLWMTGLLALDVVLIWRVRLLHRAQRADRPTRE